MTKYFFLVQTLLVLFLGTSYGQEHLVSTKIKLQKDYRLWYHNGASFVYRSDKLFHKKVEIGVTYLSTLFGSALGTHVPNIHHFQFNTAYHFRSTKLVDPFIQIDLGYAYFDDEGLGLENTSKLLNIVTGIDFQIYPKYQGLGVYLGYQHLRNFDSITPLVLGFQLTTHLFPGVFK